MAGLLKKPFDNRLVKSANWRIVIPNLQQYKDSSPEQLLQLKHLILQRLHRRPQDKRSSIKSQFQRGLHYYHIALQRHANGVPHLDILLIYPQSLAVRLTHFDYLLKHGNITTYRKLNTAILDYGRKEDKAALSNLPMTKVSQSGESIHQLVEVQELKADPYAYLYREMCNDPLHFNLQEYVKKNQLSEHISNWASIKTKLRDMQTAAANLTLKQKPGFKLITRQLITQSLTPQELVIFDSWKGYQIIVDYLNQIVTHGYRRPLKTMNLLITGPPNAGKTSLIESDLNHTHNCIERYCSIYPMSAKTWWPNYKSQVYQLISWNQAKLTSFSYDTILKVLEGSKVDLPQKGSSTLKYDNPLVIMTSNMTLEEMIQQKFNYSEDLANMARKNLAVRVQNVVVPKGLNLFLLQKLLMSCR